MIILNFSHPFNEEQIRVVECLAGEQVEKILDITCDLDHCQPFADQME